MTVLENIDWTKAIESKIDRSKWVKWKFSDLVENIVEKVVPKESGLEHYIGLEHLDSGSIKIRRFGETSSLKGDKLRIYKGDLIFAKRNAYLKRVAIADFDAVASAHSLVLRAKSENVLPEFLPFFMLSEKFWQRAIEISVGSLSPTINWKVLAKQEFLLPPKEEQEKIAELLWALYEVVNRDDLMFRSIDTFFKVKREELIIDNGFSMVRLDEICDKKISYGIVQAGPDVKDGMPYIKSSNLSEEGIKLEELNRTSDEIAQKYRRSEVTPGDIVFSLRGNLGEMNIVPLDIEVANLTQGTARISVSEGYDKDYIKSALETFKVQRRIHALSKGSTFKEISLEALRTVKVPVPSSDNAREISRVIKSVENVRRKIKLKREYNTCLQKSIINQIF